MASNEKFQSKKWVWIGGTIVALIVILAVLFFGINRFTLSIALQGSPEHIVQCGEEYTEPGADAILRGSLFWKDGFQPNVEVQSVGEVNTGNTGTYTVNYTAEFLGLTATASRNVHVVDTTAPVLTLNGSVETELFVGDTYIEPGYSAWDNYDGELTDAVTCTVEHDRVIYTVTDQSGNTTTVTRQIHWNLPPTPRIILLGEQTMYMTAGKQYMEPGYEVAYDSDVDLTDAVEVSGEVYIYHPGTYQLTYTVTDGEGNTDSVTRTVVVSPAPQPEVVVPDGKVIYLTFDDGPSKYTPELLKILDKYGVKATFFVVNTSYRHLIGDIAEAGHALGIHSCTHKYRQIYSSEEAYFADLYGMQQIIYEESGVWTTLVRFPGGSSNTASVFNKGIMTRLTQALTDTGFQYFDWNVDSCDASDAHNTKQVYQYIIYGVQQQDVSIVLQHDTTAYSINAVEQVIKWGLENGYTFLPLEPSSPAVHSKLRN